MATDTKMHSPFAAPFPLGFRQEPASSGEAPAPTPSARDDDQVAHRGDWIGFQIWVTCFLLMAAVVVVELIVGLFRR